MNRIHANMLGLALLLVVLAGCGKSTEEAILGEWVESGGTETVRFDEDGTITIAESNEDMDGTYAFVDKDTIRVELGGLGALAGPIVIGVAVDGDSLVLTMPDDRAETYNRR